MRERITSERRRHPDGLEVRWQVQAAMKNWDAALEAAKCIVEHDPDRASGWLHQACSLRRATGGTVQVACDALLPAAAQFPEVPAFPFNLAFHLDQALKETGLGLPPGKRSWTERMAVTKASGRLPPRRVTPRFAAILRNRLWGGLG